MEIFSKTQAIVFEGQSIYSEFFRFIPSILANFYPSSPFVFQKCRCCTNPLKTGEKKTGEIPYPSSDHILSPLTFQDFYKLISTSLAPSCQFCFEQLDSFVNVLKIAQNGLENSGNFRGVGLTLEFKGLNFPHFSQSF